MTPPALPIALVHVAQAYFFALEWLSLPDLSVRDVRGSAKRLLNHLSDVLQARGLMPLEY